jgi:hypothetical protein
VVDDEGLRRRLRMKGIMGAGTAVNQQIEQQGELSGWRKLTHEQARAEQRLHSSRMTPAERLEAMWDLNSRMAAWRGVDLEEREATWVIRRVSSRKR